MEAHLVAYEYGAGQAWGYVLATSAEAIRARLPHLEVYEEPPAWLTDGDLAAVRQHSTVELSDPGCLDRILHGPVARALALAS